MESRSLRRRSPVPPAPQSTRGRPRKKVGRPPKPRPPPEDEEDFDDVPLLELKVVQEKRAARATRRSKTEKEDDEKPARRSGRRRNSLQSNVSETAHSDDSKEDEEEGRAMRRGTKRGDEEGDEDKAVQRSDQRRNSLPSILIAQSNDSKEDPGKVEEEVPPVVVDAKQDNTDKISKESVHPPEENTQDCSSDEKNGPSSVSNEPSLSQDDRPKPSSPSLHDDDLVCQEDESALDYPMTMTSFRPFRELLDTPKLPVPKSDGLSVAVAVANETSVQKDMEATSTVDVAVAPDNVPETVDTAPIMALTERVEETKVLELSEEVPVVNSSSVEIVKSNDCPPSGLPTDKSDVVPETSAATTQSHIDHMDKLAETEKPPDFQVGHELELEEVPKPPEKLDTIGKDGDPALLSASVNLSEVIHSVDTSNAVESEDAAPMEIEPSNVVVGLETDAPMENTMHFDPHPALSPGPSLKMEAPSLPVMPSTHESIEDIAPMDESPIRGPLLQKEPGDIPTTDSDPTPIPEATPATDASNTSELPVNAEKSNKRTIEDSTSLSQWKRFRALSSMAEPQRTEPSRRLSIARTKICIYTTGRRVHSAPNNYDNMFLKYWDALTCRLEGDMTAECETMLNAFLKTKCLRKLHNRLILELMRRSLKTTAPISDISQPLPRHLRDRIAVIAPKTPQLKRLVTEEMDTCSSTLDLQSERKKLKTEPISYGPSVITLEDAHERHPPVPDRVSTRISGAMIIDPHVRKLAESANMKVSEHAVWLMVVAVKEFSQAVLLKTLGIIKAVDAGHTPPRLTRPAAGPQSTWITANDISPKSTAPTGRMRCITSSDLHAVIANLPTTTRSLSGWVSRSVFERSLNASLNSSLVLGGRAFHEVKKHIVSSISPPDQRLCVETSTPALPIQVIHSGLNHGDVELLKGRKSPLMRGLGRGAKDLAALKARAATIKPESDVPKNDETPPGATPVSTEKSELVDSKRTPSQPPVSENSSVKLAGTTNKPSDDDVMLQELPNSGEGAAPLPQDSCSILENVQGGGSLSLSEQKAIASRRGKGHGVKNLAMMRARSVTSSTDLTEDMASESCTTLLEANEGNGGDKQTSAEGDPRDGTNASDVNESVELVDEAHETAPDAAPVELITTPVALIHSEIPANTQTNPVAELVAAEQATRSEQKLQAFESTQLMLSNEDQKSPSLSVAQPEISSATEHTKTLESLIPSDSATPNTAGTSTDVTADKTAS